MVHPCSPVVCLGWDVLIFRFVYKSVCFYEEILNISEYEFVSSVRSSSGYHGLIEIRSSSSSKPTFSNFSNSSDSKVKVKVKGPNMCYIFEKHGIQGYRI